MVLSVFMQNSRSEKYSSFSWRFLTKISVLYWPFRPCLLKFFKMLICAEHLLQNFFQMWLLKYAIFGADFESVEMRLKSLPWKFCSPIIRKKNYIFPLSVEKCPYIRRIMLSVRGTFLLTPTAFFPYKIFLYIEWGCRKWPEISLRGRENVFRCMETLVLRHRDLPSLFVSVRILHFLNLVLKLW